MTRRLAFGLAVFGAIMLAVRIAGYPLRLFGMHMTVGAFVLLSILALGVVFLVALFVALWRTRGS